MIRIGDTLICKIPSAGLEFSFEYGQTVTVNSRNIDTLESGLLAGHFIHSEVIPETELMQEIDKKSEIELDDNLRFIRQKNITDPQKRTRILCFITSNRLEPETLQAVTNQEGVPFYDIWIAQDNPYSALNGGIYKNIQMNYEKMRQVVLRENYDAVWVVEADTVPPLDALQKLLSVDAPIVTGLYALRHGPPIPNVHKKEFSPTGGAAMDWKDITAHWGEIVECTGGCMGCLLIRREVLTDFPMMSPEYPVAPDGPFMRYCYQKKIKQMAHLGVVCKHIKINGDVLIPDKRFGCITQPASERQAA